MIGERGHRGTFDHSNEVMVQPQVGETVITATVGLVLHQSVWGNRKEERHCCHAFLPFGQQTRPYKDHAAHEEPPHHLWEASDSGDAAQQQVLKGL